MLLYGLSGEASGLGTDPSTCDPNTQYYDPTSDSCLYFSDAGSLCNPSTQYWDPGSGQCLPFSVGGTAAPQPTHSGGSQGSGTPWWATLTQALATGVTTGITKPSGAPTLPPPKPWYTTPVGVGGIAVGLLLLVVLLRR